MKLAIVILSIVCFQQFFFAQGNSGASKIDSLLLQIKYTKNEKIKLNQQIRLFDVYRSGNDYDNSIKVALDAIKLADKLKDRKAKCDLLYSISVIYHRLNKDQLAVRYAKQSLSLAENIKDSINMGASCHRLGLVYESMQNKTVARTYLKRSLEIRKKLGNKFAIAASNNALGLTYLSDDKKKALNYFTKAYLLWSEIDDKEGIAIVGGNIGDVYLSRGDTAEALRYYKQSFLAAQKENILVFLRGSSHTISKIYANQHKTDSAFHYLSIYTQANDSLFNLESNRAIEDIQTKYETEKKEQEINYQKELVTQNEIELRQQQTIIWGTSIAGVLLLILLTLTFYAFQQKKKTSDKLYLQKQIIEEKNRAITDSITYAERIQQAILRSEEYESKHLPEHFIFFKPKDIVSGDFYWAKEVDEYLYFAVADCTGHGVPGALMSMLGITLLNDIMASEKAISAGNLLDKLRTRIIKELNQKGNQNDSKDGMDISMVRLHRSTKEIQWAGSNNPLWILKKGTQEIVQITPDKQPIAFYPEMSPFTSHSIQLGTGDIIYTFTDGYVDQFGGPKGKKFKSAQLKKVLLENSNKSMNELRQIVKSTFKNWQGDQDQIDDVCMLGVRL